MDGTKDRDWTYHAVALGESHRLAFIITMPDICKRSSASSLQQGHFLQAYQSGSSSRTQGRCTDCDTSCLHTHALRSPLGAPMDYTRDRDWTSRCLGALSLPAGKPCLVIPSPGPSPRTPPTPLNQPTTHTQSLSHFKPSGGKLDCALLSQKFELNIGKTLRGTTGVRNC